MLIQNYVYVPINVASAERSFSKLKLIKSYLRNTMSQTSLSGLTIISIENERAKKFNMSALINTFAQNQSRKKYSQLTFNIYLLINIFKVYCSTLYYTVESR
jgi:hemolysin activation/secretion protein